MFVREDVVVSLFILIIQCYGEFVMPDVTLEAYEPKGFRVSIPAIDGIQLFAFHGNVNKEIRQVEPGEYHQDFTTPTNNNIWSYFNPDLQLKVGDVVNYWIFIQYEKLGYRKDNQKWTVTELLKLSDVSCQPSPTVVAGKSLVCKNSLIFEDNFSGQTLDENKWKIEEYIPINSLDFEFVSYQKKQCAIKDRKLFIKPKLADTNNQVLGELDLRDGCTKYTNDECYYKQENVFIIPPVTSGQIISKISFRYGKVEIKAKLPRGDWIYPQLYLQQEREPRKKLWIGYARGNDDLLASNGEDIGGRLLFGGPIINPEEPSRSQYLKSTRNNKPFTNEMHIYSIIWTRDEITVQVDGSQYGRIDPQTMKDVHFGDEELVRLVLGVGVGGINDFPDEFRSGSNVKPWRNKERAQAKKFFGTKDTWKQTWAGDNSALQIEYVKIVAL